MPHDARPIVRLSRTTGSMSCRPAAALLMAVGLSLPATVSCASPIRQHEPAQPAPAAQEQQAAAHAEVQAAQAAAERALAQQAARTDEAARRRDAARAGEGQTTTEVIGVSGGADQMAAVIREMSEGTVRARAMNDMLVLSGSRADIQGIMPLIKRLDSMERARLEHEKMRLDEERKLELRRRDEAMDEQRRREMEARERELAQMPPDRRVADVQLSGTLGESLGSISNQFGGVNVVYTDDGTLEKLPVRSVSLHRVTLRAALAALEGLCGGRADLDFTTGQSPQNDHASFEPSRPVVMVAPARGGGAFGASRTQLAVFRLDPVNGDVSPEDRERITEQHRALLEAIVLGLELVGRSPGFKMQIHPQTGMLFVHGTPDELRIVSQVLDMPMPELAPPTPPVLRAVPLVQDTVAASNAPAAASPQALPAVPAREALPARPAQPAPRDAADDALGGTPTP